MIDVYEGQGRIDWAKVKASGVERAYIKFWESGYGLDHFALANIAQARTAGVQIGLYYFAHPRRSPHDQAHEFLYNASDYLLPGDLPPALDLEVTDGFGWLYLNDWKSQWLAEVDAGIGGEHLTVFYSYYYFWKNLTFWPDRPIWGAGSGNGFQPPGTWTFWQYGLGDVPGVQNNPCDLDKLLAATVPVLPAQT